MKRTITWILVIAVIGVMGYDVSKWITAARTLNDETYDLTALATQLSAPGATREQVGIQLAQIAAAKGIRVYQYDQNETDVRVWTETDVKGTIVLAGVWNLIEGEGFAEAFRSPFTIRDYGEAGIK